MDVDVACHRLPKATLDLCRERCQDVMTSRNDCREEQRGRKKTMRISMHFHGERSQFAT